MKGIKNAQGIWNKRTTLTQMSLSSIHRTFRNLGVGGLLPLFGPGIWRAFFACISRFKSELK